MIKPETPADEKSRLQNLRSLGILDTPPEERFDRLTRIATRLFDLPIALVSLIDENRQWFKSSVGLPVSETPRDISLCGHTILNDEIFVVNDATKDKRFFDNPLISGDPNIRFYAGCPLKSSNGSKLGTLCIIDKAPRELSISDRITLKDLAAVVERELELTQLATNDELTGIPNRRGFKVLAEKSLRLCQRKGLPASIAYFDINRFKQINNTYGHAEGDRVLTFFAKNMEQISRNSDVFARLGGDEFVILFTDANIKTTESIVARFSNLLEELSNLKSLQYKINFSYGVVGFNPDVHSSIEELLHEGDQLMYSKKHANTL